MSRSWCQRRQCASQRCEQGRIWCCQAASGRSVVDPTSAVLPSDNLPADRSLAMDPSPQQAALERQTATITSINSCISCTTCSSSSSSSISISIPCLKKLQFFIVHMA